MKIEEPKLDPGDPNPAKYEDEMARCRKLRNASHKSRIHWSFSDIPDEDWPFPGKA